MKRCLSRHAHPGELSARMCDAALRDRLVMDRIARPAQYVPIAEPTIPPTPRWLNRAGKDLTENTRSN